MTDKRLTQSPRALRDSTNDPEAHAKGDVDLGMDQPRKEVNENDNSESYNSPYIDGGGIYSRPRKS